MEVKQRSVIIKPVKKIKFSGVTHHTGTGTSIEGAQLSKQGYKTGLTKKEEEQYCEELGLPKGTLSKNNGDFWGSCLNLRLTHDKPYTFIIETLMDEIKLKALLNNSRIAENELKLREMPMAEFYVEDAEARAKIEEVTINYKMEAIDALRELSSEDKKGYLRLYGKRGLDAVSDAFVNTQLFKEVDLNPQKFLGFVSNPDIKLRISIEEMIESGVLTKKGHYYNFQNEVIGNSVESVIDFFRDLKNQSIKIAAESESKKKKK